MSYNKSLFKQMVEESKKKKSLSKPKDRIVDPMGQWAHPGEITVIPGDSMATHGYGNVPLYVEANNGFKGVIPPNVGNVRFPGATQFTEYPLIKAQAGLEQPSSLELAKIKAKMAMESHFGNPSARRMTTPYPQSLIFKDRYGKMGRGTHYIADDYNYVFPIIQEGSNGKLFYNQNASPFDREAMRFETPEDARSFAKYYKMVAPMMRSFKKNGGDISIPELPKAQIGKQLPPIYLNDPKDPRIGMYNEPGNQYLYRAAAKQSVRAPIYTNNPNDPRLQAYNDSVINNQNFIKADKLFSSFPNIERKQVGNKVYYSAPTDVPQDKQFNPWSLMLKNNIDYDGVEHDMSYFGFKNKHPNRGTYYAPISPKPVQPVIYQKPIVKQIVKPKPRVIPDLKMVGQDRVQSSVPSFNFAPPRLSTIEKPKGDYVLRYIEYDENGNPVPREVFHNDRSVLDQMMGELVKDPSKTGNWSTQGNYQEGGQLRKAQFGEEQPTRADSIFLLKNNKHIQNLLNNRAAGYKWADKKKINPEDWKTKDSYYKRAKNFFDTGIKKEIEDVDTKIGDFTYNNTKKGKIDQYRKKTGKFLGTSDWKPLGGDDLGMPMHYITENIAPQFQGDLQSNNSTKYPWVFSYGYDDLAITPWDMLSPKQKEKRIKLYGTHGTPIDKINPSVLKKVSTERPVLNKFSFSTTASMSPRLSTISKIKAGEQSIPIYGPGNAFIGSVIGNTFIPDNDNTAARPEGHPDSNLLNNADDLRYFLQRKGISPQFKQGGSLPKFQVAGQNDFFTRMMKRASANQYNNVPSSDIQGRVKPKSQILAEDIAKNTTYRGAMLSQGTAKKKPHKSKFMQVATNPMTAAGYLLRGQELPENLDAEERNVYDYAIDIINPFFYLQNAKEIPGDIAEGELLNAGLKTLSLLPVPKILKSSDKYLTKVGRTLAKIEKEGIEQGLDKYEIAKRQMEKVGITSNQRKAYNPILSPLAKKYITPYGYNGINNTSKLSDTFKNIKTGGVRYPKHRLDFDSNIDVEREDAWRLYLGIPQKHETFKIANTAPINHFSYNPKKLANMDIYSFNEPYLADKTVPKVNFETVEQPEQLKTFMNMLRKNITYDRGNSVMGGYNRRLTKHGLEYNDIWDLQPSITPYSFLPEPLKKTIGETSLFIKKLPNNNIEVPRSIKFDVGKILGKPFMTHELLPHYTSEQHTNYLKNAIAEANKQMSYHPSIYAPKIEKNNLLLKELENYPKFKQGGQKTNWLDKYN